MCLLLLFLTLVLNFIWIWIWTHYTMHAAAAYWNFIPQIYGNFPRNYSGKVPLFFRKNSGNFRTHNPNGKSWWKFYQCRVSCTAHKAVDGTVWYTVTTVINTWRHNGWERLQSWMESEFASVSFSSSPPSTDLLVSLYKSQVFFDNMALCIYTKIWWKIANFDTHLFQNQMCRIRFDRTIE